MHNPRLRNVINAALNLAVLDGGFVIAIQIIDCLLNYFGASLFGSADSIQGMTKGQIISSLLSILNLSVIITRITGLARGFKFSVGVCYEKALRRWPLLLLLYIIGGMMLFSISIPMVKLISTFSDLAMLQTTKIMMMIVFALIPYGLLACIFVVDQDQNPFQAIKSTFNLIKNKVNFNLLLSLSLLYCLPLFLSHNLAMVALPYLSLFSSLWLLFCHLLTLIIYMSVDERQNISNKDESTNAKVFLA